MIRAHHPWRGATLALASLLAVPAAPSRAEEADDPVQRILLGGPEVPEDALGVIRRLEEHGGDLRAHLVVNGGHDNPARGGRRGVKFMCFMTYENAAPGEVVEQDELFFGFFLGVDEDDTVVVLPGFVELIAWDRTKEVYNFWELDRDGWHLRGDSDDILADIEAANLGEEIDRLPPDGQPRLRCSGCHTLGGPVMKELAAPHNDWWTAERKLDLGPFRLRAGATPEHPASVAERLFLEAADASNLGRRVREGVDRLIDARGRDDGGPPDLKRALRPLFTSMEVNLVSDREPFASRVETGTPVEIPPGFFVDARLLAEERPVPVDAALYAEALEEVGSRFAPDEADGLVETHHAFLVPARSHIDNRSIDALIERGLLDEEFVADVLAVDFKTPVFSGDRASLIRHVPEEAADVKELRERMIATLEQAPAGDRAAQELLANLTDPARTADAHREEAEAYLDECDRSADELAAVVGWLRAADRRRAAIEAADTAKHAGRMNIVERGFRVVFPVLE